MGDWAVQVTKAWSSFQQSQGTGGAFNNLQYNQFDVEVVAPGAASTHHAGVSAPSDQWAAVLTFPKAYAGQSVGVSFQWTDNGGTMRTVTGQQHQLPQFGRLGGGFPYVVVPFAKQGDYTRPPSGEEWKNPYFTFVQGASLRVRTIWRDNPRRWEMRTLETFLNRR